MRLEEIMENKSTYIGCTSIFTILLQITFIVLKLTSVINWTWVWVLSPIWIYAAINILFLVLCIILIILD